MMCLRYILSALISLTASLLAFIFADIIALFIKQDGELPLLLKPFSTADNPAIGDKAFNQNQMPQCNPETWFGRYRLCRAWVRRNPGYWLDYTLGVTVKDGYCSWSEGNLLANIGRTEFGLVYGTQGTYRRYLTNGDGRNYFECCMVWTCDGIWYRIQFGWHLHTLAVGQRRNLKCTFNRW